ncbi:MAG: helix-turn-helix domain-containing protein [Solirubrobacteraceae bacterium]
MADDEDRLLSVAEVAKLLSVTEPTIREWIKDGKLQAHRAGARFWRIRQSEVNRMLSGPASSGSPAPGGSRLRAGREARDLLSSLIVSPTRERDGDGD